MDAVECAVKIQQDLKEKNASLPENRSMEFRIGVNLGDVIDDEGRIYGDGVNVAARVEGLADGGGICISGTTYDQIENKLGLEFEYLGERAVKNVRKPVRVYQVRMQNVIPGVEMGHGLPLPDKPSIAVLPFVNMSDDPNQEYFSDGLAEEIITALSKVHKLFVIARNSSFVYKGKPVNVQQVSRELGVKYILEGSVRRNGDQVRITAQLIDATTGNHLWAERYDREMKDIFAIQDEITMKILASLQVELTKGEEARMWARGTNNLDAYMKVLAAIENVLHMNKESNNLARQMATAAIDLDPQYADAYTVLAATHMFEVWLGTSSSPMQSIGQSIALAQKALSIDQYQSKREAC